MKKVMFMLLVAAAAFGYTFPGAFPYDALVTYDHGAMPLIPGALHLSANPTYWTASKYYYEDSLELEDDDIGGTYNIIAVPIDLGYSINERILVDLTLQFLMPKFTPDEGDAVDASGLGDVWVKGRYIAPVGNMYLGGRLGVKIPVGKVDYEDENLELGDDQMDIDVAVIGAMAPEVGFAMNGALGFRYRMDQTIDLPEPLEDATYTPGMLIYANLEPGYSMGKEKAFQIYVPIEYEMSMTAKADDEEIEDSETSGLALGLAPKYTLDLNNTIGLKFLYPLMGDDVYQAMQVGLTYEGYIVF